MDDRCREQKEHRNNVFGEVLSINPLLTSRSYSEDRRDRHPLFLSIFLPHLPMKKSFTLGAVSGISALAIAFPLAAQFASAQSGTSSSPGNIRDRSAFHARKPLSQDDVQALIDQDNNFLLHADAFLSILKEAVQNHRIALQAAADITDETERNEAVKAAHEAMRTAIAAAVEANPDLQGLKMMPFGTRGPHGHAKRGAMPFGPHLAEKLGLTAEELKEALDSGKTIDAIAEEQGVELPTKPRFRPLRDEDDEVQD